LTIVEERRRPARAPAGVAAVDEQHGPSASTIGQTPAEPVKPVSQASRSSFSQGGTYSF
jgi:hypothetical protein